MKFLVENGLYPYTLDHDTVQVFNNPVQTQKCLDNISIVTFAKKAFVLLRIVKWKSAQAVASQVQNLSCLQK